MGHIAAVTGPAEEEFDHAIDDDEPFGLQRNRRDEQHDDGIGVHDAEGEQQTHHGTRRADKLDWQFAGQPGRGDLDQRRTDAADHVVDEEALRAQFVLQRAPEHPQTEHVEEDVLEIGVQEHVGDELVGVELHAQKLRSPDREGEQAVDLVADGQQRRGHIGQYIYDNQVLDNRRRLKIRIHGRLKFL